MQQSKQQLKQQPKQQPKQQHKQQHKQQPQCALSACIAFFFFAKVEMGDNNNNKTYTIFRDGE